MGCCVCPSLLFSASASFHLCLTGVVLIWWLLLTFVSIFVLMFSWPSVSLASVSFGLLFCSGTLHFLSCPGRLSLWVTGVLPPWSLLLVLLMLWPCVVLVHLLRNSVVSRFLRDGVLPLGRVTSGGCFFCVCSCLGRLCPLVVHTLPIMVDCSSSSSALGWAFFPRLRIRSFGVPFRISLHGGFRLPVWAGFFSFLLCCHLFPFRICPHSPFYCLCRFILRLRCSSSLISFVFLDCPLCFTAGGELLVSSPLLPSCFSFSSSSRIRPLRLASSTIPFGLWSAVSMAIAPLFLAHTSIPSGPLYPWYSVACLLPYRLL